MPDNQSLITAEEYTKFSNLLKKIIKSIIPIYDQYTLEDHVQECIIFLFKKRKENPTVQFKTSYLKHVAVKICVDSIRNIGTNIKYYCTACNKFFHRKERAVECHAETNKEGNGYGVTYNQTALSIFHVLPESQHEPITLYEANPEKFVENKEFFEQFYAILSQDEQKILDLMLTGVNNKKICFELNITNHFLKKSMSAIRFTYYWYLTKLNK